MHKIVIVGHPLSGYQEVETLLNTCGMGTAQPSRREGFLPTEISRILCKVHSVALFSQLKPDSEIQQIQTGQMWYGMALDLMLGNLEQNFWGWADPQAIYLLNYWKDLDPKITFILVYNSPHSVLMQEVDELATLTPDSLDQQLRNWCAYNAALLHFFHRNPERCLLVHARQVRESAKSYLQQVRARIDAPLTEPGLLVDPSSSGQIKSSVLGTHPTAASTFDKIQNINTVAHSDQDALKYYLAEVLLIQHPASLQLYEELQSVASLPLAKDIVAGQTPFAAWQGMASLYGRIRELSEQVNLTAARQQQFEQQEKQLATLTRQAKEQTAKLKEQEKQLATLLTRQTKEQTAKLKEIEAKPATNNKALEQENELLLLQLHQVQEELERYYLENQQLKVGKKPAPSNTESAKSSYYGAADRIRRQLSYRLGTTMIAQSRSFTGWIGMPWALIREIRQFRSEKAQRSTEKLPPIDKYRDAHEAEKVKQHLSYRLGATLIAHSGSPIGWVKLPWAIGREIKDFKRRTGKNSTQPK
ncbi:conserved hypothetical protein [Gammaproteobacteria bacterium]